MSAMREKDSSDYDLERFIDMFDKAMTSNDPRVKNALRQLMMMVILTDTGDHESERQASHGPLRRMQEEIRDISRALSNIRDDMSHLKRENNRQTTMQRMAGVEEFNDISVRIAKNLTVEK
jgi:uncharacterized tellurite resistance protein B-like protein